MLPTSVVSELSIWHQHHAINDALDRIWLQGDIRAKLGELQGGPSMWGSLKSFAAAVTWTVRSPAIRIPYEYCTFVQSMCNTDKKHAIDGAWLRLSLIRNQPLLNESNA